MGVGLLLLKAPVGQHGSLLSLGQFSLSFSLQSHRVTESLSRSIKEIHQIFLITCFKMFRPIVFLGLLFM